MVDGLQTTLTPALVVDLDGTYIRGNTLHIYLRTALRMLPWSRKMALAWVICLRALRVVPHTFMKFRGMAIAGKSEPLLSLFAERVKPIVNPEVAALIAEKRKLGWYILLATAAAVEYVPTIWPGDYVATETATGKECRGEEKLRRVRKALAAKGATLAAVATDDPTDDAPLLAAAPESYIIKTSSGSIQKSE